MAKGWENAITVVALSESVYRAVHADLEKKDSYFTNLSIILPSLVLVLSARFGTKSYYDTYAIITNQPPLYWWYLGLLSGAILDEVLSIVPVRTT